ncbi:beta-amyrin 28-monooxygenase-like [Actinidia eriantha]|uniref:beta-amyrin 28-monooxygenase-like n=1 Tax=Actinidia eriantha TaxID=165200 RepID=UPI00258A5659|nr:beta-amyrin 28-monooxygenase-like [Actinidia eriantha]
MVAEHLLLLSLLFGAILFLSFFSLHYLIYKCKHKPTVPNIVQANFPTPPGRKGWPLVGETLDFFSELRNGTIHKFITDRRNKYRSKVFRTSLIGHPMAIFCGAEGNKFLFSNENKLVQIWWPASIDKIFPKSHNKPNNEDFVKVRKMLSAFLKPDALQKFVGTVDTIMKQHMQTDWIHREQVEVSVLVSKLTLALACRLFLSIDEPRVFDRIAKPINDISAGMLSIAVNFPGTNFNRALKASKMIREELEVMIRQRKIDLSEKRASSTQDILSHMLLAADESGRFFKEADIASYLVGLLHGGYGTLNAALTFIMKYLAEFPDVYHQVQIEQMEIAKSKEPNEMLNWDDLRKMRYTWNAVNEVLRLMPPVFGAFREAITQFNYGGHMIPKGWKLHWNANSTHRNSEYFPNPEKFDPSRFEGDGPAPYTFVPFGGGPRMCPGNEYTRMVILVFIHNVVMKFRWEKLLPDEKVVIDPHPRPTQGLPIRLHPHKP